MGKVNFTQEHMDKLKELAVNALFKNLTVNAQMGQPMTVNELLHTVSINSLSSIRANLVKQIDLKEQADEWSTTDREQKELSALKEKKDLVNLIIGYKRYQAEIESARKERARLEAELTTLKESTKTPEDKIKELEAQLKGIDSPIEF